jgi:CTP-dependent riboflavin kinase
MRDHGKIERIPGAMVAPAADVRVHGKNIIEIISHLGLKGALGVGDGGLGHIDN